MESAENSTAPTASYDIRAREVILKQSKKSAGTETFVYEPATIDEEPLGNLYILGSLKNRRQELDFLPNLVASAAKREFYKINGESAEERFAACCKNANGVFADIAQTHEGLARDVEFCIMNIAGEIIRFSRTGSAALFLSRGRQISDLSAHAVRGKKDRFFSTIVSGPVASGDRLMASTKEIPDLFSDKGLRKLFTLRLDEQGEVITGLYEKNGRELNVPDQAAILLEIRTKKPPGISAFKERLTVKNVVRLPSVRIPFSPGALFAPVFQRVSVVRQRIASVLNPTALHGNRYLVVSILCGVAVLSGIVILYRQTSALGAIAEKIAQAETLPANEREAALALLTNAHNELLTRSTPFYLIHRTVTLQERAGRDISRLNGIYTIPPVFMNALPLNTVRFLPRFIFDDAQFIYIFGEAPHLFYQIEKTSWRGMYVLLAPLEGLFATQRMFAADNMFYFVNDEQKTAYVYDPAVRELLMVQKTLAKTLGTVSRHNERETDDARWTLTDGKIIKTQKQKSNETKKEIFLLGSIPTITDFTVSPDGNALYLLTERGYVFLKTKE
ncbi:MAG: hypothetical protein AAB581_02330 [Patescibacteria group bacterium]